MRALDTNVLARFFIDDEDDPEAERQRPAAVEALSSRAFVSVTVLLEFEWVMRAFYGLSSGERARVLGALAGIEHVTLEDRAAVLSALDLNSRGMNFADGLHLVRSAGVSAFVTFDQRLAKRAAGLGVGPPIELLR